MRRLVHISALMFVAMLPALAEIEVYTDDTEVVLNRPFNVYVRITGSTSGYIELPEVEGLTIGSTPAGMQSNMQIVNGKTTAQRLMTYRAEASRLGRIMIPAFTVQIDGRPQVSQPVTLTVVKEKEVSTRRSPSSASRSPRRDTPQRGTAPAQPSLDDAVFITSELSKEEAYQGEALELDLSIWVIQARNLSIRASSELKVPSTEGFYVVEHEPTAEKRKFNDWPYDVTTYSFTVYPTTSGTLEIGPWHWEGLARIGDFFDSSNRQYSLDTDPITVQVKPLPEPPPEFSGAVGSFTFSGDISERATVEGAPVTLTFDIAGEGNPDAIGAPHIPEDEAMLVSEPDRETTPLRGSRVRKTFRYLVTPLKDGVMQIPAASFCYFDADVGEYKTLTAGPFNLNVAPSKGGQERVLVGTTPSRDPGTVKVLAKDIRPLVAFRGKLTRSAVSRTSTSVCALAPPLVYLGIAFWMLRKRRFEKDQGYARKHFAKSRSRKRLQAVSHSDQPAEELFRALSGFIADVFNRVEAGITSSDATRILREEGVSDDIAKPLCAMMRQCERARYGASGLTKDQVRELVNTAAGYMDALHTFARKGKR